MEGLPHHPNKCLLPVGIAHVQVNCFDYKRPLGRRIPDMDQTRTPGRTSDDTDALLAGLPRGERLRVALRHGAPRGYRVEKVYHVLDDPPVRSTRHSVFSPPTGESR
jgi:hypothetical protein